MLYCLSINLYKEFSSFLPFTVENLGDNLSVIDGNDDETDDEDDEEEGKYVFFLYFFLYFFFC